MELQPGFAKLAIQIGNLAQVGLNPAAVVGVGARRAGAQGRLETGLLPFLFIDPGAQLIGTRLGFQPLHLTHGARAGKAVIAIGDVAGGAQRLAMPSQSGLAAAQLLQGHLAAVE